MTLPPIFCLTLAEEPWKQATAEQHFNELGIEDVTFIYGFHGMLLGLRPTNPLQFDRDGKPEYMHIAQTGCAISHLAMLTAAVSSGLDEFICCEDDTLFTEGISDKWLDVRSQAPQDIDVIQLEYISVCYRAPDAATATPVPTTPISPGLVRAPYYGHCAACIWWTRRAAIQALRYLRPVDTPYDVMLIRRVYPFMNHALCDPPLATQRTAYGIWPSSISSQPHALDKVQI